MLSGHLKNNVFKELLMWGNVHLVVLSEETDTEIHNMILISEKENIYA